MGEEVVSGKKRIGRMLLFQELRNNESSDLKEDLQMRKSNFNDLLGKYVLLFLG